MVKKQNCSRKLIKYTLSFFVHFSLIYEVVVWFEPRYCLVLTSSFHWCHFDYNNTTTCYKVFVSSAVTRSSQGVFAAQVTALSAAVASSSCIPSIIPITHPHISTRNLDWMPLQQSCFTFTGWKKQDSDDSGYSVCFSRCRAMREIQCQIHVLKHISEKTPPFCLFAVRPALCGVTKF